MPGIETPVLIAGGSLVGLSTAMLLGHHGIPSLVVEQHRGTAIHPRAAQISQRTMEIFRSAGVEEIVRRKSGEQFSQDGAIMAVETLAGKELAWYVANLNDGVRDVSPCERVFISQSLLEPVLKDRAIELGAELRFSTEMLSFEQDASGVTAEIRHRDTGETSRVRARYLVACDGAHSLVRQCLGIPMRGRGAFSNSITIYFHADVAGLLRGRNLSVIYVINRTLRGFFRFETPYNCGFLAVNAVGDPANAVTDVSAGLTEARCLELVRAALGDDSVPVTVDNVMHWQAAAEVAGTFQAGRVFLAGDAAHVMPPNGGFGGNTGVQDAHNLAWKLAWVLKGRAGSELLSTYEAERRPIANFTVEQAYTRYVTRTDPRLGKGDLHAAAPDLNVELGYLYGCDEVHRNPRDSPARSGSRAPHVWVSEGVSTLDWFGRGFVLLASHDTPAPAGSELRVADNLAVRDCYGISQTCSVLVRPDGFIAP